MLANLLHKIKGGELWMDSIGRSLKQCRSKQISWTVVKMEDQVRATYICINCDTEYVQFNIKEGQPAKCPQCNTTNYPGYEVNMTLKKPKWVKNPQKVILFSPYRKSTTKHQAKSQIFSWYPMEINIWIKTNSKH